jgi:uncharacterized iron-regulated protein
MNAVFLFFLQRFVLIFLSILCLTGCCLRDFVQSTLRSGIIDGLKPGDILETRTGRIISSEVLLEQLDEARVVYVGETHTRPEDHRIQEWILKGLYDRHPSLVVALEMFPREAQPLLDRFYQGEGTEEEFLRQVNWEEIWGYPFRLYRPLVLFAREKRIPLVGLNAPREVVNKIARQGLAGLTPEQRGRVAETFDLNSPEHRDYVREEFERHVTGDIRDFETFYEAQAAWEETMAETLVQTLKALPETTPVMVLIGNGHIWQERGVPRDARRRLEHSFRTIIPLPKDYELRSLEPAPADYVWITPVSPEPHRPRLGITLRALSDGEGLAIDAITAGGRAEQAGFEKEDVIESVNGAPARTLDDLHQSLADPSPTKRFGIRRNGKEMEISVDWGPKIT